MIFLGEERPHKISLNIAMGAGFKCASDLSQLYFIGRPEGDNRFGHGHSLKKEDILSQGHTELLETCLNP